MYVCGMTPKEIPHIGHGFMFVHMDVIRRYLEHCGYEVQHLQNFTDIDDKIIARASSLGQDPLAYAEEKTQAYFEVLDQLRVRHADKFPTVSESIPDITEAIQNLIDRGYAYRTSHGVYFSVAKFARYGALSGRKEDVGVEAGARVDVDVEKNDPRDFALWKLVPKDEIGWTSPWGRGRPGWHIECSAMVQASLGNQIDIHGGGADLLFPHHENEIAQAEAGSGETPFVRHWLHTGLVQTDGEKMSHSSNNFTSLAEVLSAISPDALRLHFLSVHYRTSMVFSHEAVLQSHAAYERLLGFMRASGDDQSCNNKALTDAARRARVAFESAMDDDFNAPRAIGGLFELGRSINREGPRSSPSVVAQAQSTLRELLGILGIELHDGPAHPSEAAPYIELLIETRSALREARQWELADRIRDRLMELGVAIEDGPTGTEWHQIGPT